MPRRLTHTRRELLAAGAAAGAAIALGETSAGASGAGAVLRRLDFAAEAEGPGWGPGWRTIGVANLRRQAGEGVLEAGSDVFPNDPRPVAFALDSRFLEGGISAVVLRTGAAPGLVLRRRSPRAYYAAIYDTERLALVIVRRSEADLVELANAPVLAAATPITLEFRAVGANPTRLEAALTDAAGARHLVAAGDADPRLQRAGDPGALGAARTLLPSGNPVLPALGNLHLLPYAVQEGQAILQTPVGEAFLAEIRRRSTVGFREIVISTDERARTTKPSVVAATSGVPLARGARLHVATDVPARVEIELSRTRDFRRVRRVRAGRTGDFDAAAKGIGGLAPGERVYWRARVHRRGRWTRGPVRTFRVLPRAGSRRRVTLAVGSCGAQFGAIFDHVAARRPDVFVWQGDLNYPDTHGPLAQTMAGYAGIWRDFLANPRLAPIVQRACFVAQRDDHDYGVQDANSTNIPPWGLAPWDALLGRRRYYRFSAGLAEVWVLEQRRSKSDPEVADTPDKTLLGRRQRRWLLRTLTASRAPFKVICSPCTVLLEGNVRDGSWVNRYSAERDLILRWIAGRVSGRTIFLTGDTHLTGVYDREGRFEARAAPIDIPTPNDVTLVDPLAATTLAEVPGVAYASDQGHFSLVEVRGEGRTATMDLTLIRQDGAAPYTKRWHAN